MNDIINEIKIKNDNDNNNINSNSNINNKVELPEEKNKKEKTKNYNIKYNDEELNELRFITAIKYDKRTYCQFYISLLKTKHNLFFTFIIMMISIQK
jgi:hypothetical protein